MTMVSSRSSYIIAIFLLANSTFAFVPSFPPINTRSPSSKTTTARHVLEHHSLEDLDAVRELYEAMIGPMIFSNTASSVHKNCHTHLLRPLLTNAARKRRMLEIELLKSLATSDDAVDELMSLWMVECPKSREDSQVLVQMEQNSSTGEEENQLRAIIQDSNEEWAEPMNRLALMLFYKGNYKESKEWVTKALQRKPWHFEAIQMQVLLALATSDKHQAIHWSRKNLPPLDQPKRRQAWVQKVVQQAQKALSDLEDEAFLVRNNFAPSNQYNVEVETVFESSSAWQ